MSVHVRSSIHLPKEAMEWVLNGTLCRLCAPRLALKALGARWQAGDRARGVGEQVRVHEAHKELFSAPLSQSLRHRQWSAASSITALG